MPCGWVKPQQLYSQRDKLNAQKVEGHARALSTTLSVRRKAIDRFKAERVMKERPV
jgi:hypothetical protein